MFLFIQIPVLAAGAVVPSSINAAVAGTGPPNSEGILIACYFLYIYTQLDGKIGTGKIGTKIYFLNDHGNCWALQWYSKFQTAFCFTIFAFANT